LEDCQHEKTVIAIPTAGRQAGLRRLLSALAAAYGSREDVHLLVVDNDAAASSRSIFDEWSARFGDRSMYVVEPVRGYASVRNAVLANAGDVAAIAMIDDDEIPTAGWLDELLAAQRRTRADVVAGPVLFEFPADAPGWFQKSGVFDIESPTLPEGAEMKWCASNNTLLRVDAARRVPGGFDPKFNAMSGEDSHYFLRAHLRGCKIVWTNAAVVREVVPASRLNRSWILKRAIRAGNTRALIELELIRSPGIVLVRFLKAAGLLAIGAGYACAALLLRDRALGLRAINRVGRAYGMFLAFRSLEPWAP
jgi:succinoglycan biosynthesis protein ExoM